MRTRSPERITRPSDYRIHPKFPSNFREREFRSFVSFHGCVRNNLELADLRQIRDEFVGQAVHEILLLWVLRQILQWKYGNRANLHSAGLGKRCGREI